MAPSESLKEAKGKSKHKSKKKGDDTAVKALKHYDVFYTQAPPGLIQEEKERPEDTIPDLPENKEAREFLAKAPQKGLWMPLGKEVKVMKCWRCKKYGHRTGDRECPMFVSGNLQCEKFRFVHEDPMHDFIKENKRLEQEERIKQLQALLDSSTSESGESSDSDSSTSSSSCEKSRKKRKRSRSPHKAKKRKKKASKKKKHKKHKK